jgi:cytoskeletal protein CcmA (bactofilin family)
MSDLSSQNSSLIIGEGVTFVGSISAPGRASINGTVTGEISVADLQIGPKGSVTGQINAQVIDVHGVLAENIVCHDHILIHRSGSVAGNLDYSEIEIERGGQFKGQMTQHPTGQVQAKAPATPQAPATSKPFKPGN